MKQVVGPDESGLTYKLDLQEGSELYTPSPNRQARSLPICVHSYGYFVAGPNHFTYRDQYRCLFQIFLTHNGIGRFTVDGEEFMAEPNTLILLDCGRTVRYESTNGIWEHEWVNFTGSACKVYYDLINPEGFTVYNLGRNWEIEMMMHQIRDGIMQQDMRGFVHSSTQLIQLLDMIYGFTVEQQHMRIANQHDNIVRSVMHIEAHYTDKLSLEQLAKVAYLSKYHYTRSFKKHVGMTPYEYVSTVRISHAQNLLLTTSLSVEEIGWKVGFSGSKNLIRQFKQATGMTPGEYRRAAGGWNTNHQVT